MKIIKKIIISVIIIFTICIIYNTIFKIDLWNIFILPLIMEIINTIF